MRNGPAQPVPFSIEGETPGRVYSIEFRPVDRMTEKDRELAADSESSIGERAGFAGIEFNAGKWAYQQVVCPSLPGHLFLEFTLNGGAGDVSLFSASIPRGGDGKVRIIPIQRRGYSLFSPAPINALTISAFNHIRAEEHSNSPADWLSTGLCYAALAGAHPQVALDKSFTPGQGFIPAGPTALDVMANGQAIVRFVDVAALPLPTEWSLTFNGKGQLLKATHARTTAYKVRRIPMDTGDVKGKLVPAAPNPNPTPVH